MYNNVAKLGMAEKYMWVVLFFSFSFHCDKLLIKLVCMLEVVGDNLIVILVWSLEQIK